MMSVIVGSRLHTHAPSGLGFNPHVYSSDESDFVSELMRVRYRVESGVRALV